MASGTTPAGRRPLVAGNWKMNTTVPEGLDLVDAIVAMERPQGVDVAVLPPFTHLWPVRERLRSSGIRLGAQDVFWEDAGAFTGEISPRMLAELCDYALVGHSERRHLLGESDDEVARKLRRVLAHDLTVILAVGETLAERERAATLEVVHRQLDAALNGIDATALARCVVAYEPVWAIGTGRTATAEQAQEVCAAVRQHVADLAGGDAAQRLIILYGGSVSATNAVSLFAQPDVDGGLIGGASLKPQEFIAVVAAAADTVARPSSSSG